MSSSGMGTRGNRVPILVSACLMGMRTRYDGGGRPDPGLLERLSCEWVVPVCPEQLGGLPTPRTAQDIFRADDPEAPAGGGDVLDGAARVLNREGKDVTGAFLRGAAEVVSLAERLGAKEAYLAAGSPSCAVGSYPSGREGGCDGVAAAALRRAGIEVHDVG